ncbi:glycerophosphodiester phosphodiesterase family protein [Spirosoma koreense]
MCFILWFSFLINLGHPKPAFDLQGHRGCRGLRPENTLSAFLKALDLGVTTLEMDVVISQDHQVVVSHEPYFSAAYSVDPTGKPVTKKDQKKLQLYQMSYTDIRQYDVGANGNPAYPQQQKVRTYKPLLSEVIEQAEAYRKIKNLPTFSYNIEIKSDPDEYAKSQPDPATFCNLVQAVLKNQIQLGRISTDRIIIQSFDFNTLRYWKQQANLGHYPDIRVSALVQNLRSPEKNIAQLGFRPDIYSPNFHLLSKRRLDQLHTRGILVIPWTVNNLRDMKRLKEWGVDGIITDYPDRASGI